MNWYEASAFCAWLTAQSTMRCRRAMRCACPLRPSGRSPRPGTEGVGTVSTPGATPRQPRSGPSSGTAGGSARRRWAVARRARRPAGRWIWPVTSGGPPGGGPAAPVASAAARNGASAPAGLAGRCPGCCVSSSPDSPAARAARWPGPPPGPCGAWPRRPGRGPHLPGAGRSPRHQCRAWSAG